MAKTIENLFFILHYVTDILIVLLFLLFISRTKKERVLFFIFLYSSIDLIINTLDYPFKVDLGLYVWPTFTFFEYLIFTFVIWVNLKKRKIQNLILILSILFILFTILYNITTNFRSYDSIPIGIETILILLFSFYYLYEQMNDTSNFFIYTKYQFWLVIGFMIYLAGSFFVFIFASRIGKNLLDQYWFLTNVFYSIMNILFSISFLIFIKSPARQAKNTYVLI
jgi:hypothetical protein